MPMFGYPLSGVIISICKKKGWNLISFRSQKRNKFYLIFSFSFLFLFSHVDFSRSPSLSLSITHTHTHQAVLVCIISYVDWCYTWIQTSYNSVWKPFLRCWIWGDEWKYHHPQNTVTLNMANYNNSFHS